MPANAGLLLNYWRCYLTYRGGLCFFRLLCHSTIFWKGIWPTKSWKFISLGLNDDQGFRLGCIWKENSSDLNQRCYELGSRIILFWIVDLEPEGIKVAEHYVAV